ncbi:MAG: 50S ribosomal protein L11 methyltransferase, partial [Chloroflexota bacterium]
MSEEPQKWIELAVEAEAEAVEAITELFGRYGYNQGVVIEEPIQPGPDGGAEVNPAAPVKIRTYLPLEVATKLETTAEEDVSPEATALSQAERIQKLREGLYYLGMMRQIGPLEVSERREEDWANAWKEFYQVHRVGRRTVIKPPWQPYTPAPKDLVIEIDPGMAFGTGLHPTTRLCLTLSEDYLDPSQHKKLLDLGTGSGILAIAAAKLKVAEVIGVDTDAVAVRAAQENIERNGLKDQVIVEIGSLAVEAGSKAGSDFYSFSEQAQKPPLTLTKALPFDAIIANIIARIIVALAGSLAQALRPGGLLITSGIIAERAEEVEQALAQAGFELVERREEGDWIAFAHRQRTEPFPTA